MKYLQGTLTLVLFIALGLTSCKKEDHDITLPPAPEKVYTVGLFVEVTGTLGSNSKVMYKDEQGTLQEVTLTDAGWTKTLQLKKGDEAYVKGEFELLKGNGYDLRVYHTIDNTTKRYDKNYNTSNFPLNKTFELESASILE